MTEAFYGHDPDDAPVRPKARLGHIINIAGAVTSVALLAGVAWWGYRLAVLDVTGLPVLQAGQGPMRIAPADPGGRIAAHAGLSVNTVVATGAAGGLPDQIVLAPPPTGLQPDDFLRVSAAPAGLVAQPAVMRVPDTAPAADPDAAIRDAVDSALVDAGLAPAPAAAAPAPLASDPGDGLPRSLRPRARPGSAADDLSSLGVTAVQTVAASAVAEIEPATLRPGTRLAQIGAYDDAPSARADWDRIAARAGALMAGKARVLQPATSAGRDFIRLRVAEFESEDDARRFCKAIESGDLRCIPVTHR